MRSAYNTRPPAPEVMVIEGEAHAVSARQTVDELLALETIRRAGMINPPRVPGSGTTMMSVT